MLRQLHPLRHRRVGRDDIRFGGDASQAWNWEGRVNLAMIHAGTVYLPFNSRHGKYSDQYFGWREAGNFGIAFRKALAPDRVFARGPRREPMAGSMKSTGEN